MKAYPGSLKDWRLQQRKYRSDNPSELEKTGGFKGCIVKSGPSFTPLELDVYFNIFRKVLDAMISLESGYVTHYDIKCDNLLISPFSTISVR